MSEFFGPAFAPGTDFSGILDQLDLQGVDTSEPRLRFDIPVSPSTPFSPRGDEIVEFFQ